MQAQREADIQGRIITALKNLGWLPVKLIQTNLNGVPDIMALKSSRTVFIEVKKPNTKPTELQTYRHEQLKKQGFEVIIARSLEDIKHLSHAER